MKLEVGRITRAHGIRGEVVVDPITDRTDRFSAGHRFESARGELAIESSRPFGDKFLVTFTGVATRTDAEALRGTVLLAEALEDPDDDEWYVHQLIGAAVRDQHGVARGTVVAVEANPASDLLVLDDDTLVPMVFVVAVTDRVIDVEAPAGLFG